MDVLALSQALHNRIDSATTLQTILAASKAVEALNLGTVKTVATYTDLLGIFAQEGEVYFVDDENRLYFAMGDLWFNIFDSASLPILSWGANTDGRLGDGTTTSRSSPGSVVGGIVDWVDSSASSAHSLALRANGSIWAWGCNASGRLGDNNLGLAVSSPVSVVGGFDDWISTSAGGNHSLGLRANGTVWCWGCNNNGQLGDLTTTARSSPVSVAGVFTDWTLISAGIGAFGLALRSNGTLWAWGTNSGRLGNNLSANQSSPVSVVGGFADWTGASAGSGHSLGLRSNGSLWAWGANTFGTLGDGTTVASSSPVSVIGGFSNWTQISAGGSQSMATRSNGSLWAWGANVGGRLGDGTTTNRSSPVSVVGGFSDWRSISTGENHSVAVRTNGTAWAWGENTSGILGDNTTTDRSSPVSVVGGFSDWISASAGGSHSLAVRNQ